MQTIAAQPPETDVLRNQIDAVMNNTQLSQLERVRELRLTIDREETALIKNSIIPWIEQLNSRRFASRRIAQQKLVDAGELGIDEVARAATQGDSEQASRCLSILEAIAANEKSPAAAKALEALRALAEGETPSRQAADMYAELTKTDKERAIEALEAIGARVSLNETGDVRSVTAIQGLSDREMKLLAALPRMTTLFMTCDGVTSDGLRQLRELPILRSLYLMKIDDDRLKAVGELSQLSRLTISASPDLSDRGLAALTKLNIRTLSIRDSQITDDGLQHLKSMMSLTELGLKSSHITDHGLEILGSVTSLLELDLESDRITDHGLEHLSKMSSLDELELESGQITDQGLEYLSKMTSLTKLGLESERITDDGLESLNEMTSLTSLYLSGARITDQGLQHLSELTNLTYVRLRGTSVSQQGADKLQETLPRIRRVYR